MLVLSDKGSAPSFLAEKKNCRHPGPDWGVDHSAICIHMITENFLPGQEQIET
jgi:hypothetical protein